MLGMSARRPGFRLRMQLLINELAPKNRRRLLRWRQVAADQVFVDLGKLGVKVVGFNTEAIKMDCQGKRLLSRGRKRARVFVRCETLTPKTPHFINFAFS